MRDNSATTENLIIQRRGGGMTIFFGTLIYNFPPTSSAGISSLCFSFPFLILHTVTGDQA